MARKKKQPAIVDPEERARLKKLRALQRREARKLNRASRTPDAPTERASTGPLYSGPTYQEDDFEWIRRSLAQGYATKILNNNRERPYWLSIRRGTEDGAEPVAHVYPCAYFRTPSRVYYSFAFREHRDMIYDKWKELHKARKETHDRVTTLLQAQRAIAPSS